MKTANEIKKRAGEEQQNERMKMVNWAFGIIGEASEAMYERADPLEQVLNVPQIDAYKFLQALKQPEVKACLEENGFRIIEPDLNDTYLEFYLHLKDN